MRPADSRPILITGGAGFIGCNIADRLAGQGHEIRIYDSLSRPGVERNLEWLKQRHGAKITSIVGDVRDEDEVVRAAADVQAVFHMAAQVAVTTSLVDPRDDFTINVRGTVNVLDAVRVRSDRVPVIFASTNKVYGDFADVTFSRSGDRYEPEGRCARPASTKAGRSIFTLPTAARRAPPTNMCWIIAAASTSRRSCSG